MCAQQAIKTLYTYYIIKSFTQSYASEKEKESRLIYPEGDNLTYRTSL